MSVPEESDCEGTDECVCPYCGYEDTDSWEIGGGSEQDGTTQCARCSREFGYSRVISVSYSTYPIIGPHELCPVYQREDSEIEP